MRYLLTRCYSDGRPAMGSIGTMVGDYQSDGNARRFMALRLRNNDNLNPGPFLLERWPENHAGRVSEPIGHLYKRV